MAVSHAEAGADFVAPSDMMDGRIRLMREMLEQDGYHDTGIMAYSAKYASCYYGPFLDALDSATGFGAKKTNTMDPSNVKEASKEAKTDEQEGDESMRVTPGRTSPDVVRYGEVS